MAKDIVFGEIAGINEGDWFEGRKGEDVLDATYSFL
jgi:hypothetical protein